MLYLFASCIALLIGPIFYRFFSSGTGLQRGLDGFIFVSLGGLVLMHILPELTEHGGLTALIFVLIGVWGPTLSERLFHRYSDVTHKITIILGVGGLLLHTITDGGAMVLAQQGSYSPLLALGVILHRLPVGLAIWCLLRPQVGTRWAVVVIAAMMSLTGLGYFAGEQLFDHLSLENTVYLQAFVTGSILHVVLHQPHNTPEVIAKNAQDSKQFEYQSGIGSLLGILMLCLLMLLDPDGHEHAHNHSHGSSHIMEWLLTLAPVLLLSYAAACLRFISGLSPQNLSLGRRWFQRMVGPEAIIISGLLLGPWIALLHLAFTLLISGYLALTKIEITDPHEHVPSSAIKFGFSHLVDRSAPWIIFSLILANLIGHPGVPLTNPLIQIAVLLVVFLPMRFCNLGAAVLSLALAYSGWSPVAFMLPLIAAPIFNLAQLKLMTLGQKLGLFGLIAVGLIVSQWLQPQWHNVLHLPHIVEYIALALLTLLFAASLLRLGPRKFLRRLMVLKAKQHTHHH